MSKNKDDKRTVELLDQEILDLTFKRVGIGAQLNARSGGAELFKQWCDTQAEIQRLEIERTFLKTGTRGEVPPTSMEVGDRFVDQHDALQEVIATGTDTSQPPIKFLTPKDALDMVVDEAVEKSAQELGMKLEGEDAKVFTEVLVDPPKPAEPALTGARAWLAEQQAKAGK